MCLKEKLTERIENELWEMLECKNWTPCHVETIHYLAEIMRDIKKMAFLSDSLKRANKSVDLYFPSVPHIHPR